MASDFSSSCSETGFVSSDIGHGILKICFGNTIMIQKRTEIQEDGTLSTQPLETDFPGCVNHPFIVVDLLYTVTIFHQKCTAMLSIHLKISIMTAFGLKYIWAGLYHSERKIPKLLNNNH